MAIDPSGTKPSPAGGGTMTDIGRIITVGVYGWSADRFFAALRDADVSSLVDIRARRGVRGRDYVFANRMRLEAALADAGITYLHVPELVPTPEVREAQKRADRATSTGKRHRSQLSPEFIDTYRSLVLDVAPLDEVTERVRSGGPSPALLCVERSPDACHRSIAAATLSDRLGGVEVEDLLP